MKMTYQVVKNYEVNFPFEKGEDVFVVTLRNVDCSHCNGSGKNNQMACSHCNGTGNQLEEHNVEVLSEAQLKTVKQTLADTYDPALRPTMIKIGKQLIFNGKQKIVDFGVIESFGKILFRIEFANSIIKAQRIPIKSLEEGYKDTELFYSDTNYLFRIFKTEENAQVFLATLK